MQQAPKASRAGSLDDEVNRLLGGGGGIDDEVDAMLGGAAAPAPNVAPQQVEEKLPGSTVAKERGFETRLISGIFGADPGDLAARERIDAAARKAEPERDTASIGNATDALISVGRIPLNIGPTYDEVLAASKADPLIDTLLKHYQGVRTQSLADIAGFRDRRAKGAGEFSGHPFLMQGPGAPSYSNPLLDRGPKGERPPDPPPSEPLEFTDNDVAHAVWTHLGKIEGVGQAAYDAEHPVAAATADILGFIGPLMVGGAASKGVQVVAGAEKLAGMRGLAVSAARWGAFDAATQAQALFAGGQDDFDWQRLATTTVVGGVTERVAGALFPRSTAIKTALPLTAITGVQMREEGKAAEEAGQPYGAKERALAVYKAVGMAALGGLLHRGKGVDKSPEGMRKRLAELPNDEAPKVAAAMAEQAGKNAPEVAERLSPFTTAEPANATESQLRAKQAKLNKDITWESLKNGTLKRGIERLFGDTGAGKRIADYVLGHETPREVEQMNAELRGPWLERLLQANEANLKYEKFLELASGGNRALRDQVDRVVGYSAAGLVPPAGFEIPVEVVERGKVLATAAKETARTALGALQDASMLPEGIYRLPDGSELLITKRQFDNKEFNRESPPGELIRDYKSEDYWPQLPGESPSFLKRLFFGRSGGQLSAKVLNAANDRLMKRTRTPEEHAAAGGEMRLSKGFAEIAKEINAAHQKSQLDWLFDRKLIRDEKSIPQAEELAAGKQEMLRLRFDISKQGKELGAKNKAFAAAKTPEEKGRALSAILAQHEKIRDLRWSLHGARYMTTPQDWVQLGPEWGKDYAGKYMRADMRASLVEGYREPASMGAFLGGLTSVLSSNLTYKNLFGHFPRDYLSNRQQMSLGGTRPWSIAGIKNEVTAWKQVVDELGGKISEDPVFRAWFAEVSGGGDRISGAGQFNARDLEASKRFLDQAALASGEGRDIVAMMHKGGAVIARMSEVADKIPVVNLGTKFGRLSDLVPAYHYYRMLRTGEGSSFGYPMSHAEAIALHDAYFSYSAVAPLIRDISTYAQFLRFPVKQTTSSLKFAATKPMRVGIPFTEKGANFNFPLLDQVINADPTSGKAQAAMAARMAVNLGVKAASVLLPVGAVAAHQRDKLGITDEEWDGELERSLSWAPEHIRDMVKALSIPYAKDASGRIKYIDVSDFVPWTALPKYLSMPAMSGSTSRQDTVFEWLPNKNLIYSALNSAFGKRDFKGENQEPYDFQGNPTRSIDRILGAIQPLLPGVLAQAGQGAIRLAEMVQKGEQVGVGEVAKQLFPVFRTKATPGGNAKEKELGKKVTDYDHRGLMEQYPGEDGMTYLRVRQNAGWKDKAEMRRASRELARFYEIRARRKKHEAADRRRTLEETISGR